MEVIEPDKNPQSNEEIPRPEKRRFILTGIVVLLAGALLLYSRTGNQIPEWFISWEIILIIVGIFIGEKHRFKNPGFLIPIGIGLVFLISDIYPEMSFRHYIGPGILIIVGLFLILKPQRAWRRHDHHRRFENHSGRYYKETAVPEGDDYIDSVSIFGSTKKNIMSKNFRGGEATSFFGGTEVNLMLADIQGHVVLELTQIFGGCKLIVPPHWEIKSEIVNIFGGTEDKRPTYNVTPDHTKVLVVKGTSIFGGIEFRSY